MEMRHTELQDERELLEATPTGELYTAPTHMITDNSLLVTVSGEQRGHLPTWVNLQDTGTTETCHVPLCSTDESDSYGLDSDEHGHY
eukprot:8223327-Pyramimonas_sp.AAC.1